MFITCFLSGLFDDGSRNSNIYNGLVSVILFITLVFANFAESVAEGRGKAQAESLKKTKRYESKMYIGKWRRNRKIK